jgi:hypothetical protein
LTKSGGDADFRGTLMSCYAKCEGFVVVFFPSTKVIFVPLGFCYLAKFLMRQREEHHLVLTAQGGVFFFWSRGECLRKP